jgi:DNA gyrase subunit A
VEQITMQSRYGGGVKVMRLAEETRIVSLTRAPHEEEVEIDLDLELDGEQEEEVISDSTAEE